MCLNVMLIELFVNEMLYQVAKVRAGHQRRTSTSAKPRGRRAARTTAYTTIESTHHSDNNVSYNAANFIYLYNLSVATHQTVCKESLIWLRSQYF